MSAEEGAASGLDTAVETAVECGCASALPDGDVRANEEFVPVSTVAAVSDDAAKIAEECAVAPGGVVQENDEGDANECAAVEGEGTATCRVDFDGGEARVLPSFEYTAPFI